MGFLDFVRAAPRSLLLAPFLLCLPAARAAAPPTLPFQAVVKTAGGAPVTSATPFTFSLYTTASGGTALWSETQTVTPDANGVVAVRLGAVASLAAVPFDQPYFVGVKAGSDAEMTPRLALGSAPTAFSALHVPYSGVSGAPSSLPPSGPAGGDLSGSYPGPAIAADAVDSTKLAADAASLAKVSGSVMTSDGGNIGIGTASPGNARLRVVASSLGDEVVDQQQFNVSYGAPGTLLWQSFTAGKTGVMTAIGWQMTGSCQGTLSLRTGEGTGGTLLLSQSTVLIPDTAWRVPLTAEIPVTAGQKYTWIVDVSSASDGFAFRGWTGDPYPGGKSDRAPDFDYAFKTYVRPLGPDVDAMFVDRYTGYTGIGTTSPMAALDVNGVARVAGFQLTAAPGVGKLLTSDGSGYGSWQTPTLSDISGGVMASVHGNIGVNAANPTAALEVHGDVKLGDSGQYSAVAANDPMRFVAGDINGDTLTINQGSGFTVERVPGRPIGGYRITFKEPFTAVPVVTATADAEADGISASFSNPTETGVDVLLTTSPGGFRDARFSFIAMGGR